MIETANQKPMSPQSSSDDVIDLAELFGQLNANRNKILAIAAAVFFIAAVYAFVATPIYTANALLQVEQKQKGLAGMEGVAELFGGSPSSLAEIEIIRSRSVLGPVVQDLNLHLLIEPNYFPVFGRAIARWHGNETLAEPLLGMSSFAWGGEQLDIGRFEFKGDLAARPSKWFLMATGNDGFQLLDKDDVPVLSGKAGELASAEYEGSTIELFIRRFIANPGAEFEIVYLPIIEAINRLNSELGVGEQGKDTNIIGISIEGSDKQQLKEIINTISNQYVRSNVEQKSKEAGALLDFISQQLPKMKEDLDTAEAALEEYKKSAGTIDLGFEAQNILRELSEIDRQISELELERLELSQKFTDIHPTLAVVRKQIEELSKKKTEIEAEFKGLPETEWGTIQKRRDVEVANELYLTILNKQQNLKMVKEGTLGNVRIVDEAMSPFKPVKPRKTLILAVGMLLGLFLGALYVLITNALKRAVEDSEQIEKETGISVFASIPHSELQGDIVKKIKRKKGAVSAETRILTMQEPDGIVAEAFRSLRTALQFASRSADNNVIAISGPAPGVGKSFVSLNLAAALAEAGKRVLIVDADMRRGHLNRFVGTEQTPGLSELIAGKVTLEQTARSITEKLSIIATGERPPNPSELLMSEGFERFIEQASAAYDQVIIDTAPILAVTDASIIATHAAQLFLLLRSGQHPMREIQAAIDKFRKSGVNITGAIMNDVQPSTAKGGYGYHYHYNYK
jgi:tyrosine-protein kinase Etk/Wzc